MRLVCVELLNDTDIPALVDIARKMQEECEPDIPFDEVETYANCLKCLKDIHRTGMNCWIVRDDLKVVGFAVGVQGRYLMFTKAEIASLTLWYVLPEYRNRSRAAFELLHNFESWAILNGAFRIEVGAARVGVEDATKLNHMFARRGFTSYGELFYRKL